MKGVHPTVVYVLLFAAGVMIFFSLYTFSNDFISEKKAELQEVQADKLCNFLKKIEGERLEAEIELGDYRIETSPLRIIAGSPHSCSLNTTTQGNCSGLCMIESSGEKIIFK